MTEKIGLIAGSGQFPILFATSAIKHEMSIYTAAYVNEANPERAKFSEKIEWLPLGQVKRLIRFFKQNQGSRGRYCWGQFAKRACLPMYNRK